MAEQNLSVLFDQLNRAKKSKTILDKYEICELTLTQQRELLSSVFDQIEAPARLGMSFNKVISDCTKLTDTDKTKSITVAEKAYILREIRELSFGDVVTKEVEDPETGEVKKVKYKFTKNTIAPIKAIKPTKEIKINDDVSIIVSIPTIEKDNKITRELLSQINAYRRRVAAEKNGATLDSGKITGFYYIFELIKYVDKIKVGELEYNFDDMITNEQMRAIDSLAFPVSNQIAMYIQEVRDTEKAAFTIKNTETGQLETIDMNHAIFSNEI